MYVCLFVCIIVSIKTRGVQKRFFFSHYSNHLRHVCATPSVSMEEGKKRKR